jgi:hypothetical protein
MQVCLSGRDIGERDINERDVKETFATYQFTELLLIHIEIRGVSGVLRISQCCDRVARFLRIHKAQQVQSA